MKNVIRILPSTPIKLRVAHKRQFIYRIQNPEKKKLKNLKGLILHVFHVPDLRILTETSTVFTF